MRRLLGALILAGGALGLAACGPAGVDIGYGSGYYGYAPDYYYGGYGGYPGYGYYGGPYYGRGVVIGHGGFGHEHHEAFEHEHHEAMEHGRAAPAMRAPAASFGHAPAPHFAGPPPAAHHH